MRDRLIELLDDLGVTVDVPINVDEDGCGTYEIEGSEYIADYLIENDVIVSPCKVGDEIWVVERENGEAVDIGDYMFLANSKGCIIATYWIDDYDLDETLKYHINETQDTKDKKGEINYEKELQNNYSARSCACAYSNYYDRLFRWKYSRNSKGHR